MCCSFHACNHMCLYFHTFPSILRKCPPFPHLGQKQGCVWDGVCGTGAQSRESTPGTRRETSAGCLRKAWGLNSGREIRRVGQFLRKHSSDVAPDWRLGTPARSWGLSVRAECLGGASYSPQVPSAFLGICWTSAKQLWANKCHISYFMWTGL